MQLALLALVLESDLGRRRIGWFRVGRPVIGVALIVPFFFTSLPTGGNDLLGAQHVFPVGLGVFLATHHLSGTGLANGFIFLSVSMSLCRSLGLWVRGRAHLARTRTVLDTMPATGAAR
ncbi:hypothetical protein [Streptomyces sp. AM6-12]|uniref:hypothetical protein n=1 Tax=Streptomyces sp. AM6-12 TaxID=3345149 RepID=UPI0037BDFC3E